MNKKGLVGVWKRLADTFNAIVLPMVAHYDFFPHRRVSNEEMFRQMREKQRERLSNRGKPEDCDAPAAQGAQGPISRPHV